MPTGIVGSRATQGAKADAYLLPRACHPFSGLSHRSKRLSAKKYSCQQSGFN